MSILIKGMEMPENCDKCIYSAWSNFYQIYVCNAVRKNEPVLFDKKQVKSTDTVRSNRADNCPLIPVPEHGRLGDLDALVDWLKLSYGTSIPIVRGLLFSSIIKEIQEYPSVIPAEQKSKEEGEAK